MMKQVSSSPLLVLPSDQNQGLHFMLKDSPKILSGEFIGHDFVHYPTNETAELLYYSYADVECFEYASTVYEDTLSKLQAEIKKASVGIHPITCVYHGHCSDGLMSAAVVKYRFKHREVNFVEGRHGSEIDISQFAGQVVFIVDFSFDSKVLADIGKVAECVIVLDHHKSTMDHMQEDRHERHLMDFLKDNFVIIADQKSGCGLTWEILFPNTLLPEPVAYIQDSDIWTWKKESAKVIVPAIYFYYEMTVEDYYNFLTTPFDFDKLYQTGSILKQQNDNHVKDIVKGTIQTVNLHGYTIGIANCNFMHASLVGHYIMENHPKYDFAMAYRITGGGVTLSLRSEDHKADVSYFAQTYLDGGGHRNAAGARLSVEDFYALILNNVVKDTK